MILLTANKRRRLLYFRFIQHVTAEELRQGEKELRELLTEFSNGFCLLTDLEELESMDADCAPQIGHVMELMRANGVELVVRIIPDVNKDIGLNILSGFHYDRTLRTITCENIAEALRALDAGGMTK